LAIVLGSVLDGIPESFVLGLTILQGGVSLSLLAGVALSNLCAARTRSQLNQSMRRAGHGRSMLCVPLRRVRAVEGVEVVLVRFVDASY
jgi:zinc transporter, ZIP family